MSYQEVFQRLSPKLQEDIRLHMIRQVQGTLMAIAQDRTEVLHSRFRLTSVLNQVAAQKQFFEKRPDWGTW